MIWGNVLLREPPSAVSMERLPPLLPAMPPLPMTMTAQRMTRRAAHRDGFAPELADATGATPSDHHAFVGGSASTFAHEMRLIVLSSSTQRNASLPFPPTP